jgi:hypothetical protein
LRRIERSGWIAGVWSNTWPSLLIALLVAVSIGLAARHPPAATLHELWKIWHPRR